MVKKKMQREFEGMTKKDMVSLLCIHFVCGFFSFRHFSVHVPVYALKKMVGWGGLET